MVRVAEEDAAPLLEAALVALSEPFMAEPEHRAVLSLACQLRNALGVAEAAPAPKAARTELLPGLMATLRLLQKEGPGAARRAGVFGLRIDNGCPRRRLARGLDTDPRRSRHV